MTDTSRDRASGSVMEYLWMSVPQAYAQQECRYAVETSSFLPLVESSNGYSYVPTAGDVWPTVASAAHGRRSDIFHFSTTIYRFSAHFASHGPPTLSLHPIALYIQASGLEMPQGPSDVIKAKRRALYLWEGEAHPRRTLSLRKAGGM